jgi:DMSO/TMAO reductase YedYZ molybdopterin-dependent catalytic subunit
MRTEASPDAPPAEHERGRGALVRGAVVGALVAFVAVGVAELVAGLFFDPGSSPILAVGAAAVDATPEWLKSFAISTFGSNDKAALLVGISVVLLLAAMAIGAASARRPVVGVVGLAAFAALGVAAVVSRPANGLADAIPTLAGAAAGAGAYVVLRRAAGLGAGTQAAGSVDPGEPPEPRETPGGYDRRRFLRAGLVTAGTAAVAGGVGRVLVRRSAASESRAAVELPPVEPNPTPPEGFDDVPGISPFITPNDDFYRVDTALFVPAVEASAWRLKVHGMVDREMTLSYDDLLARPMIERDITLACVSNEVGGEYIGNARWVGAPLADLLREAGVHDGATQIVSRSVDGFTIGTPTDVVMDGRDSMLAVSMNGEPLPLDHGFPVRMLVPGLYGYVSAMKWLVDLELTTLDAYDAYWVQRGWAQEAPIKTQSRIDTPKAGASVKPGPVIVAGVAWAQHRGITAVEVSVDGGRWAPAELAEEDTIDTWRQWRYRWEATSGPHRLAVRATDGDGEVQTADLAEPFPDGATGHHTVDVRVR